MAQKPYLPRATMSTGLMASIMVCCPLPSTALFEIIHPHSTALLDILHLRKITALHDSAKQGINCVLD